jgi:hypothetical protein
MTLDSGTGTPPVGGEAPATGTPLPQDEVTLLKSRAAGLDAKVSALLNEAKAANERATAAEARALALADEKTNGDIELRAQLEAQKLLIAKTAAEAKLARIEAKYPETFGVLGEASGALTEDQLAASEARFAGVAATPETPVPIGANPGRQQERGPKAIEDMSVAELEKHLKGFDPSVLATSWSAGILKSD